MPKGPGKYDDLCSYVLAETKAQGVVVMVIDGDRGCGFSSQIHPDMQAFLPSMLEFVAATMRTDSDTPRKSNH